MGRQAREKRQRHERARLTPSPPTSWHLGQRLASWLWGPAPIARLAAIRILVPLAILGFLSSRLVHADDWIGSAGFHVPNVGGGDYRQPLYLPALPNGVAWTLAGLALVSGMALSAGAFTRVANPLFAALLVYFALADRLAAFTVSKLGAALVVALAFTPSAARASLDALRFRRANPDTPPPTEVTGGNVRFFQLTLAVMYAGTGVSKLLGDWLTRSDVIYTNLHDSYQTTFSYLLAAHVPGWAWTAFQWLVLTLETGAPLWLALPFTRRPAVALLLGMHAIIGLGFGPVIWFALLMASLLLACFAPRHWLERALRIS